MSKAIWREAWHHCRAMNWGTLSFHFHPSVGEACRSAWYARRRKPAHLGYRYCVWKGWALPELMHGKHLKMPGPLGKLP